MYTSMADIWGEVNNKIHLIKNSRNRLRLKGLRNGGEAPSRNSLMVNGQQKASPKTGIFDPHI
jgi:hypothetical protein